MSITTVTAYPSKYANEGWLDNKERADTEAWADGIQAEIPSVGKFYLRFGVRKDNRKRYMNVPQRQRELAEVIGAATRIKPVYERKRRHYDACGWQVLACSCNNTIAVASDLFDIDEAEKTLRVLEVLHDAGYVPDDGVDICFTPDVYDLKLVTNLCNIMAARNSLIVQALNLDEEIRIYVDEDLAFGIMLDAFSFEKIEACVYLLRQASLMAMNTGKARMKPCDGSNPKYQMRTWLLRLGFIGDQFARPRQTLLSGLDGDGAFFSEDGKDRATMKRKSKRMAG